MKEPSVAGLVWLTTQLKKAEGEDAFAEKSDVIVGVASLVFSSKPIVEKLVELATAKKIKREVIHLKPKAA